MASNSLDRMTSVSAKVCYHPSLSREEAERKLHQFDEDGVFLIRDSGTDANALVISLLFGGIVRHYKILRCNNNRFRLSGFEETKSFETVQDLVHYYSQAAKGILYPLLYPCPVSDMDSLSTDNFKELGAESLSRERSKSNDLTPDWILDRDEIVLSSTVIGEGAWGRVLEGTYGGCKVAVKEIHNLLLSPYNRRLFEREMTVASKCRHPCLLQFFGATNDDQSPLLVTELMDTSLKALLHRRALKPEEITNIVQDIANGLNYLHLKRPDPIIHRDISSANILLWKKGANWRAKISDFGAADFLRDSMTACPGAAIYSAPEAQTSTQSPKIDIYSFGVLLCEMNIREQPDVKEREIQVSRVTNHFYRSLIKRCLHHNPDRRPSMVNIIMKLQYPEK